MTKKLGKRAGLIQAGMNNNNTILQCLDEKAKQLAEQGTESNQTQKSKKRVGSDKKDNPTEKKTNNQKTPDG